MAVSQNLWNANDRSVIASFAIPGGKVALRKGSVGNILAWCATRWHNEVEPLVWPGNWGYAERPVRGATVLSNHASGTAIDLNAPKHPLDTDPRRNFSPTQIAAVRRIMADTGGLIRWGGDYTGRKDGMHIEVNDRVTQAQLDALWARLSSGTQTITALKAEDDMPLTDADLAKIRDAVWQAPFQGIDGKPSQAWLVLRDVMIRTADLQKDVAALKAKPQ